MTPREIEVLSQVLLGRSNKITGYELSISEHTVKAYLKRLLSKFGASDRTYAVTIANRRGFLDMHQYLYLKLHRSGNTSMTTGDYWTSRDERFSRYFTTDQPKPAVTLPRCPLCHETMRVVERLSSAQRLPRSPTCSYNNRRHDYAQYIPVQRAAGSGLPKDGTP